MRFSWVVALPLAVASSWERVELHVHLDGSMEAETLFAIADARNLMGWDLALTARTRAVSSES